MKRRQILQKLGYGKSYVHEKILRTRNWRRKFIKNLLPEKCKEKMKIKQLRLNDVVPILVYYFQHFFKTHCGYF